MNNELSNGAALVLEGVDILDSTINHFVSKLDDALPCSLCNCVAMFSQTGNEAYTGHFDSEDVLVIQLSGEKLWNLYASQQRKFVDSTHLTQEQMGPPIKQLTAKAGVVNTPGLELLTKLSVQSSSSDFSTTIALVAEPPAIIVTVTV